MKIGIKYFIFIICVYMMIFQNMLVDYFPFIKYTDEIMAVLSLLFLLIKYKRINENYQLFENRKIIFLLFLILIIGLFSNLIFKYQKFKYVISDVIVFNKFFLIYLLSFYLWDNSFFCKYGNKILKHIKFFISSFFILTILNYCYNIFEDGGYRFGIMVNKLFFDHPTNLAAICIFLLSMLIRLQKKNSKLYIIEILLVLFSTLRYKSIGASIIFIFIIYYVSKYKKKLSISKIGLLGIVALAIAYNQINYYYISGETARSVLTKQSFEIAKDCFPFGSGFGTYGSYFSSVNYSPLYYKYGLSNTYGLSYLNPIFITDTFWPMIIGQFGYIGLMIFLLIIKEIIHVIQCDFSLERKKIYISKIIAIIYILISSSSESSFVNPICILFAIVLGSNYNISYRKEIINYE